MWPVDCLEVMQYTHNLYHRLPPPATTGLGGNGGKQGGRGPGSVPPPLPWNVPACVRDVRAPGRGWGLLRGRWEGHRVGGDVSQP